MSENIICKPSPAKTLAVTAAPLRELLNFLIYRQIPELLNERARRQPALNLSNYPKNILELGQLLRAKRCESGRKLYFNCTDTKNHRSILIHNINAQFWVHYFRCGIGIVNITCFSNLSSAEGTVLPTMTRTVADSYEYQWFTHDLKKKYFQKDKSKIYLNKLTKYFVKKVNPQLISPYTILSESKQTAESYKFVEGSLENLKEVLKQAILVCETIKRRKDEGGKCYVSPYLTVTCGSLKQSPKIEHLTEPFLSQIGALAIKENVPYTVLSESHYRRVETIFSDWLRKNQHHLYLNFEDEIRNMTPREKIAAQYYLLKWLKEQGDEGDWMAKYWGLSSDTF